MVSLDDPTTTTILILIALSVVLYAEWRVIKHLRKRKQRHMAERDGLRVRVRGADLKEEAFNTLSSTQAIAQALRNTGLEVPEAQNLLTQAQLAYELGDYETANQKANEAKEGLLAAKLKQNLSRQAPKSDNPQPALALEPAPPEPSEPIPDKARLTRDFPPNYLRARFELNLARDALQEASQKGRVNSGAENLFAKSERAFAAEDYESALRFSLEVKRDLGGSSLPNPPIRASAGGLSPSGLEASRCGSCSAPVQGEDTFCRKCGTKIERTAFCTQCGKKADGADQFCRGCGRTLK